MPAAAGRFSLLKALLIASTALATSASGGAAQAQTVARTTAFHIPAQPLATALSTFASQAGVKIAYPASLAVGRSSRPVQGNLSSAEALQRLLAGTGLSYHFGASGTVTVSDRVSAAHSSLAGEDATMLDVIQVTGGGSAAEGVYTPYETAAPVAHIDQATIERYRGADPSDMFAGTPGVLSGHARNSGGSVDINIRGLQGMGRVATRIDGSTNSVVVPQGYQGHGNRTFVDPDFIAGIDITKGSDAASNGIAGTVSMRTLDARDIVDPGRSFGVRVKGGFGTNSSSPTAGAKGGYAFPTWPSAPPVAVPSASGMDRPGLLEPTNGFGSIVAGYQQENFDVVLGYAHRKRGNYHAGENGPAAAPYVGGPVQICDPTFGWCTTWPQYVEVGGLANYRPGEEVLNTELETQSVIAKGTVSFGNGHSVRLGYTGFWSEAGDRVSWRMQTNRQQPEQMASTAGTEVHTATALYKWQPDDSDLFNLKANFYITGLEQRQAWNRSGRVNPNPGDFGLPADFRTGSDVLMSGVDVTNQSTFDTRFGAFDLNYGVSFSYATTEPSAFTDELSGPYAVYATKKEVGAFMKGAWKPLDWLTVDAGLRYDHYWTQDDREAGSSIANAGDRSDGGFSPSVGLTVEPFENTQVYGRYSYAMRTPSLLETVSGAIGVSFITDLESERASNWDFGVNHTRQGLFGEDDQAMIKVGYFDWTIDNYVARQYGNIPGGYWGMFMYNLDKAKFSGFELSGRYEHAGFAAELSANYYTNVEFCPKVTGCAAQTLYGDFSTNQVPPEYMVSLSLSQKLLDDKLTLGGRVTHTGPRAAEHSNPNAQGAGQFISLIKWEPYTLVDAFAEYKFSDSLTGTFRVENLTDQFYVDPLGTVQQPGPGRTFYASVTAKF